MISKSEITELLARATVSPTQKWSHRPNTLFMGSPFMRSSSLRHMKRRWQKKGRTKPPLDPWAKVMTPSRSSARKKVSRANKYQFY